jgi:hypothetical protein
LEVDDRRLKIVGKGCTGVMKVKERVRWWLTELQRGAGETEKRRRRKVVRVPNARRW